MKKIIVSFILTALTCGCVADNGKLHVKMDCKGVGDSLIVIADGNRDQHLAPYMGVLQWDRFVEGVAATDYAGALSFETNGVWKQFDPELMPTILRYIAEAGRLFARRIEERRTSC